MSMDDNVLDSLMSDGNSAQGKKQDIRQDEITGKKFLFHSLPKEFYNWFNNYYMLEKKMKIDIASVPSAQLNGYMWLTVFDGTKYALLLFFSLVASFIKLELTPNLISLVTTFLVYTGVLIFVVWHVDYYARMRAKEVGPVTKKIISMTTKIYYSTFVSLFVALTLAFIFFVSTLSSFMDLLQQIIIHYQISDTFFVKHYILPPLVYVYNFFVDIINKGGKNNFIDFLTNPYVFLIYMALYSLIIFYFFEKESYLKEKAMKEKEIEYESIDKGYPIEYALKKIHEWREKNGM